MPVLYFSVFQLTLGGGPLTVPQDRLCPPLESLSLGPVRRQRLSSRAAVKLCGYHKIGLPRLLAVNLLITFILLGVLLFSF